jgi:hypothetical protein
MRDLANEQKIFEFFTQLGRQVRREVRVYLTGGATAVLTGWRDTTVDIDMHFEPENDEVYRALPELKEKLRMNIELAAPSDFIPPLPGWKDRSIFITREGKVSFYHYDPYSQALSKIERGHAKDIQDVAAMFEHLLIKREKLKELYNAIEPQLYRYPAIDPPHFSKAVQAIVESNPEK